MSRFPRLRRRPDHWSDPHERARIRAAERLDGPIGHVESTWLEAHLADCPACAAIAAEYEADRAALRALRADTPMPPRDLWARTAAAIESESAARGFSTGRSAPVRRSRLPLGALSAIAIIVLVVGVSAMNGGLLGLNGPLPGNPIAVATDASSPGIAVASVEAPPPSPFAVDAGNVAYIRRGPDGSLYRSTPIRQVCPSQSDASCAAIPEPSPKKLTLSAAPRTIISAPGDKQAVAVGSASAGGDQVVVVALPSDTSPDSSATPAPTPVMTASPVDTPSVAPSDTPEPTSTVGGNTGTATPPATGSAPASATPTDSQQPSSSPVSPTPTIAAGLAIASGVSVVGDSAAFSADGTWFAFTARPADGSGGPDVYVWHVGDQAARKLTADGASVFASWAGDMIIESRPTDLTTTGHVDPASVIADPVTGTVSDQGGAVWRPVVAPDGSRAVAWVGSVARGQDQNTWQPASGRLALVSWPHPDGSVSSDKLTVVADGPLAEYDVRWDETGGWFGLWVADDAGAQVGRLSLFHVDPQTGELSRPKGAPTDETAMAGFSIGKGRLAWATPPGTDGEGSRIQVVAWRDGSVGSVETVPGEDLVVVR